MSEHDEPEVPIEFDDMWPDEEPTYSFTHDGMYYVAVPFEKAVDVLGEAEAKKLKPD